MRRTSPRLRCKLATLLDLDAVVDLAEQLWPGGGHRAHMRAILAGKPPSTLPLVVFVAHRGAKTIGFVEVGLRSHADGCDARHPVGFLEGWFVVEKERKRGVGQALVRVAEAWAVDQGCREMASDTWIDEDVSIAAHRAIGFAVVDRCVHFRKRLAARPRRRTARRRRT